MSEQPRPAQPPAAVRQFAAEWADATAERREVLLEAMAVDGRPEFVSRWREHTDEDRTHTLSVLRRELGLD